MDILSVLVLVLWADGVYPSATDPCDPVVYNEINEAHRSTGYQVTDPVPPICDLHLQRGWYRFTSHAGTMMPTTCPTRLSCGTVVPIWMNGTHPSTADGVVTRQACGNFQNDLNIPCCEMKTTIAVKNCGDFYVYFLVPPVSCPQAYCAGDKAPCPPGKWSLTGLHPCKDVYPLMTTPPTLNGPIVSSDQKSFKFDCKMHMPNQDELHRFEVTWTFDGQEDPLILPQVVESASEVVSLDGSLLKGHMNSNVGCHVTSFLADSFHPKSPVLHSNTYLVGLEINPCKPGPLTVDEKDYEEEICITSTVPIVCDHDLTCCITFNLDVDHTSEISIRSKCNWDLCKVNWNQSLSAAAIRVPIVANKDMIDDGDQTLLLNFDKLKTTGGKYQNVFLDHKPNSLPIKTIDTKATVCSIWGDPHIRGFDYQSFHLYKTGDFTICEVPEKNFEVQIRTWVCGRGTVTCVCGVAIREENDIIRINQCGQVYGGTHTAPLLQYPSGLRNSTIVQRSDNGFTFAVNLASGTEVIVTGNNCRLDVTLKTSSIYYGQCRGICGTNDGIKTNEFTHSDGHVTPVCSDGDSGCIPVDFLKSWFKETSDSLLVHVPSSVEAKENVKYCACNTNPHGSAAVNCTTKGDVSETGNPCPDCPVIPPCPPDDIDPLCGLPGWTPTNTGKRSTGYVDVDVPDVPYVQTNIPDDLNVTWPSANGMSSDQARSKCLEVVKTSQLYNVCEKKGNLLDTTISDCMEDILMSGSTMFLSDVASFFTTQCHTTLSLEPSSYITLPDGTNRMNPKYEEEACLQGCGENGHCGAGGTCVCQAGWEGKQCHLMEGKGPQLDSIRGGPLCDRLQKPCETIFIDVTNLDLSGDFTVRLQLLDEAGAPQGAAINTPVSLMSAHRIAVKLPKSVAASDRFQISASNDGAMFSPSLETRVFDSTCLDCDGGGCTNKSSACQIGGQCYKNDHVNPGDNTQICNVTQNTFDWSIRNFSPTLTGPNVDRLFTCKFNPPPGTTINFRVTWLVDGNQTWSEDVPSGVAEVFYPTRYLPTTGELTCRIEANGTHQFTSGSVRL